MCNGPVRAAMLYVLLPSIVILISSPLVASASAEEGVADVEQSVSTISGPPSMAEEIAELLALETQQLADLQAQLDTAPTFEEQFKLQKQMQTQKLETEMEFLRIQLRHLNGNADPEQTAQLEAAIKSLAELLPDEDGLLPVDPTLDRQN